MSQGPRHSGLCSIVLGFQPSAQELDGGFVRWLKCRAHGCPEILELSLNLWFEGSL